MFSDLKRKKTNIFYINSKQVRDGICLLGNFLKKLDKYYMCIVLLVIEQILFCIFMATRGKFNQFMSIVLIIIAVNISIMMLTKYIKGEQVYSFLFLNLINIGVIMQLLTEGFTPKKLILVNILAFFIGSVLVVIIMQLKQEYNMRKVRVTIMSMIISLFIILLLFGKVEATTTAWISIMGTSLQITEFTKLLSMLYISCLLGDKIINDREKMIWSLILLGVNSIFYLAIEEMGTLIITYIVVLFMCFIFMKKIIYFWYMLGIITVVVALGISIIYIFHLLSGTISVGLFNACDNIWLKQTKRLLLWVNLESMNADASYQIVSAQKAITMGGLLGSTNIYYVPAEHSDYIFVALLCRMGYLFGIITLVLIFGVMMRSAIICANNDGVQRIIGSSFTLCLFIQSLIMILGSCHAFILTGVGIPYLSAGGSNYIVAITMGLYILIISSKKEIKPFFKDGVVEKVRRNICSKKKRLKN